MIRIGIIGCGKIAQVRHLPEYAANPHVELAGYYDLNTQRAQEMAAQYGGKVYDSYFDLLNDPSIDAVSICVENRSHAEITTYALYAGKHVLCEKPMAVTLAECESMVAAAERNGKHLMIGHNMRFDPVHRKAKELLDAGIIGDIITFRATMGNAGPENWSMEAGSTWFFCLSKNQVLPASMARRTGPWRPGAPGSSTSRRPPWALCPTWASTRWTCCSTLPVRRSSRPRPRS